MVNNLYFSNLSFRRKTGVLFVNNWCNPNTKRYPFFMQKYLSVAGLLLALVLLGSFNSATPTAVQLVKQMLEAGQNVQTLKFNLIKQERLKGKLLAENSDVKLQTNPFKVYIKYRSASPASEILYVTGQNNNDALIHPSSFPWTSVSLDPKGKTIRAEQHHTIFDLGFGQILSITDFMLKKYSSQASTMLKLNGATTWNSLNCYQLTLDNPNFKYVDYTVGKGENLLSIATKFKLSEYLILEKNPAIDDYNDVSAGQKIKIPSDYARKISLLLDQKTNLPVVIKVYDEQGLFEQYEYHNLQVNPAFKETEFTKTYKDYKF
jgi:outer membrane lipoprotein-sorting protein